jgi:hypothetical protein
MLSASDRFRLFWKKSQMAIAIAHPETLREGRMIEAPDDWGEDCALTRSRAWVNSGDGGSGQQQLISSVCEFRCKPVKLAPARILAIVFFLKHGLNLLLTPYLVSRSARSLQKRPIPIGNVHVYR